MINKAEKDLIRLKKTLSNEDFLKKARREVVEQRRERKAELEVEKAKLEANLSMLG